MATPNYGYEKRQRELAKKKKKEEKLRAKSERKPGDPHDSFPQGEGESTGDAAAPGPASDTPGA